MKRVHPFSQLKTYPLALNVFSSPVPEQVGNIGINPRILSGLQIQSQECQNRVNLVAGPIMNVMHELRWRPESHARRKEMFLKYVQKIKRTNWVQVNGETKLLPSNFKMTV